MVTGADSTIPMVWDGLLSQSQSFLTVEQVAQLLGVTNSWVYQHQDELPFARLGAGPKAILRMDRADLRAYLLRDSREAACSPRVRSL
jgi:excisionase family DNA binding protein